MSSNPIELAFFLLLNLLQANGSLPTANNNELNFPSGFHYQKHYPIIRHNNPLFKLEFQKIAPQLPIKKFPLKEMTITHQLEQKKRLNLYPTMVNLNEKTLAIPSNKTPRKSPHHSWQRHRRPMHWLGHRGETTTFNNNNNDGQQQENKENDGTKKHEMVRESIQTCLFLRSGCQKTQHSGHRRLASFVQNLYVQERITNGFVLHRQNKKKKFRRSRLLR